MQYSLVALLASAGIAAALPGGSPPAYGCSTYSTCDNKYITKSNECTTQVPYTTCKSKEEYTSVPYTVTKTETKPVTYTTTVYKPVTYTTEKESTYYKTDYSECQSFTLQSNFLLISVNSHQGQNIHCIQCEDKDGPIQDQQPHHYLQDIPSLLQDLQHQA